MKKTKQSDDFLASLNDTLLDGLKRSQETIRELRQRIRDLEGQIAAQPSTLTELQDRVTLLEEHMK